MEIHAMRFNPAEKMHNGDTLLSVHDRRVVDGFLAENTFPEIFQLPKKNSYTIPLPILQKDSATHTISLSRTTDKTILSFRREVPRKHASHVLVDSFGAVIPTRRKRVILGMDAKKGEVSEIGIARRISKGNFQVELYLFAQAEQPQPTEYTARRSLKNMWQSERQTLEAVAVI